MNNTFIILLDDIGYKLTVDNYVIPQWMYKKGVL